MFATDSADGAGEPAAVRRLTGLGLIPDRPGWVPKQPPIPAEGAATPSPAAPDAPPGARPAPAAQPPPGAQPASIVPAVPPPVEVPPIAPTAATAPTGALGDAIRAALADRVPPWAAGLVERATISGLAWAAVALLVVLVAAVIYLHRHSAGSAGGYAASTYSASGSGATTAGGSGSDPPASSIAADPTSIVVDVSGRVRKPGLVTLPAGARVADAITAAGGPLRARELSQVDLAARVTDGQLLLVGVKGAAAPPGTATAPGSDPAGSPAPISLSTATIDQLEALPGVGPVTAQKIIDWRTAHSGFTSVDQLQQVPGIGPAHYSEISPLVTP